MTKGIRSRNFYTFSFTSTCRDVMTDAICQKLHRPGKRGKWMTLLSISKTCRDKPTENLHDLLLPYPFFQLYLFCVWLVHSVVVLSTDGGGNNMRLAKTYTRQAVITAFPTRTHLRTSGRQQQQFSHKLLVNGSGLCTPAETCGFLIHPGGNHAAFPKLFMYCWLTLTPAAADRLLARAVGFLLLLLLLFFFLATCHFLQSITESSS